MLGRSGKTYGRLVVSSDSTDSSDNIDSAIGYLQARAGGPFIHGGQDHRTLGLAAERDHMQTVQSQKNLNKSEQYMSESELEQL